MTVLVRMGMDNRGWCIALVMVAALGLACHKPEAKEKAAEIARVERRDLASTVTATGTVKPQVGADVKVGPRISGLLQRLDVKVGDPVQKGQMLAVLEHASLDAAERDAEASVKQAEAQLELARSQYTRRVKLQKDGITSEEDLDVARKTLDVAEGTLQSVQTRLESARIEQGYATIRAPISGTVTAIATQEGETVAASYIVPTFVTIVDLSRLQVEAYVDEVDIGRVKTGQEASFTVDAFPQETFQGKVQAIIPQAIVRNNVVNYAVILQIESANKTLLRPEMTASVKIVSGEHRDALVVPSPTIQRDDQGRAYVIVREGAKDVKRPVTVGDEADGMTRIKEGLQEGDQVAVPAGQ